MNDNFLRIYFIFKQAIKDEVQDHSLFLLVLIIFGISIACGDVFDLFTKGDFFAIFIGFIFSYMILMIYSGYLGSKLFGSEFEAKTIQNLFMLNDGKKVTFIGKILAGIFLIAFINLIILGQSIILYHYWGKVSWYKIMWISNYVLLGFIVCLFVFSLSIFISIVSKKKTLPMLATSIYAVVSFFSMTAIPRPLVEDNLRYIVSILFPYAIFFYADMYHQYLGEMYNLLLVFPIFLTFFFIIVSYLSIREVSV